MLFNGFIIYCLITYKEMQYFKYREITFTLSTFS